MCRSSSSSTRSSRSGDAGDELDRAVVVGRPEAARDEADVGCARGAERLLEIDGVVPDDRDPLRHEAERERLPRVERSVPVCPLPADELAAGDDDCRAGAAHTHSAVALVTFSAQPRGSTTRRPFSCTTTLAGRSTER